MWAKGSQTHGSPKGMSFRWEQPRFCDWPQDPQMNNPTFYQMCDISGVQTLTLVWIAATSWTEPNPSKIYQDLLRLLELLFCWAAVENGLHLMFGLPRDWRRSASAGAGGSTKKIPKKNGGLLTSALVTRMRMAPEALLKITAWGILAKNFALVSSPDSRLDINETKGQKQPHRTSVVWNNSIVKGQDPWHVGHP